MIPIRARVDSPITTYGVRPPMRTDHPMAGTPCPACDGPLTDRPLTLVFIGIDPQTRAAALAAGKTWTSGACVVVHADCAGLDPESEAA